MATLTDRYVQTLVKYNDALTAQRQQDVQKQYDNWAKRHTQPQKTDIIEPVRGMSPATGDHEIEEAPADVAKIDTIADAAKNNNFNLMDIRKYLSATGAKKAANILSDLISPAISTIKRQAFDALEKAKTNAANNSDRVAEVQPSNNALANDYADIQAFAEANKNKYKSQPSRESGVVMDEYGNVDIESVKRDARERAKELASVQQNATNDIPVLQPANHSSTTHSSITSLNSPALQLAQDKTKAGEDINQRIAKSAEEWLAPDYKMTFKDAREFRALLDEWAGGDDNKYRQLGLYQMFPIGGSDTEKNLTAISKKLSHGMSAVTGVNESLGGVINFAGMLGKLAGEATGNEAIIEEINKELAQRDTDIANAQRQHPIATGAGYFAGTAAQYAATNGLLGALSGGKLAGKSVYEAGKAASNLAKAKGASTLGRAWETAKAAVPTFGTNVAKQMIPDLIVDTSSNVFNNAVNGADAKTIATDALRNIRDNAILNSALELGGGIFDVAKDTKTGRRMLKSLGINADEPAKTIDDIVEQTKNDAIESPIDHTKYTRDDYIREMAGENSYALNPEYIVPKSTDEIATGAKNLAEQIDNEARLTVQPQRTNTVQTTDVEIPEGMKERSYARNIRQGNVPTDETIQDVFATTPRTYTPVSNAQTRADVDAIMAEGTEYAQKVFDGIKGASDARFAPLGHDLAQEYAKAGRYADAVRVLDEVSEQLTKAGQMNQAAIITMVKDDPITALSYLQRQINKLNVEGQKKFGNKWNDITLTDNEIKAMQSIQPGDEESIKFMWDYVGDRIAKEYPTTMMEKLLEARKVAMLLNSRTLIRNFGANVPTLGMRWLSDRFSAVGERAYHLINPDYKLTQSLLGSGKQSKNISRDIWNSDYVKGLREGSSGKYEIPELNGTIFKRKTVYKGTAFDKLLESAGLNFEAINKKLFGRSNVHSAAETTRNLTYKLLDIGDTPFVKKNFMDRLGSYIQANGIKNVADVPQEAIDIAWQEALKATYKDNSWAVKAVSGFRNAMRKIPGVGEPLAQATIPFVQAPGNIAARMVDYSPIGGTTGAVRLINQIAKGAKNADVNVVRESIDQLAKGMTGTSLVALGIALYNSGLITGSYSSDKDQRQFQKQSGYREYALHIGDKYYTYDWAQPFAENLLIGTILADAIKRSDEYDSDMLKYYGIEDSGIGRFTGALKQGVKESVNSWFNESPLHGLADLMKGDNRSYDTDIAGNIWDTAVVDFASSFIPASVNAMAKTSDSTQRQTRDYTNEWASFLNAQKAKIPGLSDDLPAKYDTWGREMKYGETLADAAFNRFINPGDTGTDKHDPLDDEINRLFNETKDERVFPQVAPTTANGEKLTAEQYAEYQKNMGERSHEMVEDLIKSDFYKNMSDEERADMLSKIYTASKALTENELYGKEYSNKLADLYKEGKMKNVISYFNTQKLMEDNGIGVGSDKGKKDNGVGVERDKVTSYIENAENPEQAAKDIAKVTDLAKQYGMIDKDASKPTASILEKYEALGYDGLKDYGEMLTKARKAGMITETSNSVPDAMQEFYDEYGMKGVDDYVDTMDTLRKNGLVDENSKTVPKDVREIYAQSGMRGVNDYVTIETNEKGASYSGYQKMQEQIPTLTAKEYNKIFDTYSVPSENGNYNGTFSKDAELIPYLTSRAWSSDQELNIYAHALSPSVEGTWHIKNNQLYYNKPSVERWNG